jgi:hypothetical protein
MKNEHAVLCAGAAFFAGLMIGAHHCFVLDREQIEREKAAIRQEGEIAVWEAKIETRHEDMKILLDAMAKANASQPK